MPEWTGTAAIIIIAVIAVVGTVFYIGRWTGTVNTDRSTFREFMDEVKSDIKEVKADIKGIFARLPSALDEGKSPRSLTELGKKAAVVLGAEKWADDVVAKTWQSYRGLEEFEIYEKAREYVDRSLTLEMQRLVAKTAYEFALDKDSMERVLAIVLRDTILAKR